MKTTLLLTAIVALDSTWARGAVKDVPELYAMEGERVWYTALNDVAVIDFRAKQLNFFDFQHESGMASYAMDEPIPIFKVREALYKHAKKPKPENRQNHFEDVII